MAKYNTHKILSAVVPIELINQIDKIVRKERLNKGAFIEMLIENGLQGLTSTCLNCEKKKHFFSEIEMLKIRVHQLEEKNE